jgi:guanylate kinase
VIAKRMQKSWDEISHWAEYDYVLINDDLDATEARLISIVEAARLKRVQQPGLNAHVQRLQREFEEMQ